MKKWFCQRYLFLVGIILWVLLAQFAYLNYASRTIPYEKFFSSDTREYTSLARNLVLSGTYSLDGVKPTRMRQPIYPLFVASIYVILGERTLWVQVAQIGLNAITVILIFRIANEILGLRVAAVGTVCSALYLPFLLTSTYILTESLFALFTAIFMLTLVVAMKRKSVLLAGMAGLMLGLTTLTRASVLFLPIVLPLLFFLVVSRKQVLRLYLPLLFCFLVSLLPWGVRNYLALGQFSVLNSEKGTVLWWATLPDQWRAFEDAGYGWSLPEFQQIRGTDYYISAEADNRFFQAAISNIRSAPGRYLGGGVKRVWWVWSYIPGSGSIRYSHPEIYTLGRVVALGIVLLACRGLFCSLKRGQRMCLSLALLPVYSSVSFFFLHAEGRMLIPIMPYVLLLSAYGVLAPWRFGKKLSCPL